MYLNLDKNTDSLMITFVNLDGIKFEQVQFLKQSAEGDIVHECIVLESDDDEVFLPAGWENLVAVYKEKIHRLVRDEMKISDDYQLFISCAKLINRKRIVGGFDFKTYEPTTVERYAIAGIVSEFCKNLIETCAICGCEHSEELEVTNKKIQGKRLVLPICSQCSPKFNFF